LKNGRGGKMEEIRNGKFVKNKTLLFLTVIVEVYDDRDKLKGTKEICGYVVYQNLTREYLQVFWDGSQRRISIKAVRDIKTVKLDDVTDHLNAYTQRKNGRRLLYDANMYAGEGDSIKFYRVGEKIKKNSEIKKEER